MPFMLFWHFIKDGPVSGIMDLLGLPEASGGSLGISFVPCIREVGVQRRVVLHHFDDDYHL